jgi:hypothetical protein
MLSCVQIECRNAGSCGVLVINDDPCGVCKHGRARGRLGRTEQRAEL